MFPNKLIASMVIIIAAVSCKKETEYAPWPYNEITSLTITADGGEKISAAVLGDSLIVYWPSYLARPEKVRPEIIVSEKATVTPASGDEMLLASGTKISVKAQSGAVKDYFLKLVINQPPIQLSETPTFGYSAIKGGTYTFNNGTNARYIIRDAAVTKFYLVDSTGVAFEIPVAFPENTQNMVVTVPNEDKFKIGGYKVKIVSGAQTHVSENYVFGIKYLASLKGKPTRLTASINVQRGQTITFNGTGFFDMKEADVYGFTPDFKEQSIGKLQLVSYTATTATYKVPADFPAGTWDINSTGANGAIFRLRTSDFLGAYNYSGMKPVYIDYNQADANLKFVVTP